MQDHLPGIERLYGIDEPSYLPYDGRTERVVRRTDVPSAAERKMHGPDGEPGLFGIGAESFDSRKPLFGGFSAQRIERHLDITEPGLFDLLQFFSRHGQRYRQPHRPTAICLERTASGGPATGYRRGQEQE